VRPVTNCCVEGEVVEVRPSASRRIELGQGASDTLNQDEETTLTYIVSMIVPCDGTIRQT